jgi:hypothetical protein
MPHHIQDFSNPPGDFRNPEPATCLRSNERKNHMKTIANNMHPGFALVAFACLALLAGPKVFGVSPPPDGGDPGFNTAEGQNALLSLTTGVANTPVGWFSLKSNIENSLNTAVGAGTLLITTADENTAVGAGALLSNSTGTQNTANGAFALFSDTTESFNTATRFQALFKIPATAATTTWLLPIKRFLPTEVAARI